VGTSRRASLGVGACRDQELVKGGLERKQQHEEGLSMSTPVTPGGDLGRTPEVQHRDVESIEEILHHDVYTPQELARLLDMEVAVIEQQAFRGELKAKIFNHQVVSIRREDVIDWLRRLHGLTGRG
jgi:hypothetical protein